MCVCVQTYIKIHIQHAMHPHVHYNRTHTHVRARLGGTCCTKLYNYMCVCLCTDIHEYTHTIYHTSSYAHCITIELDAYTMSESPVRGYTLYVCASKLCIHVYTLQIIVNVCLCLCLYNHMHTDIQTNSRVGLTALSM